MKIIVLGGTGFIGSGVVEALARKNYNVTVGSRSSSNQIDKPNQVKRIDYTSVNTIEKSILGHDFVVNCIANVHGENMSIDSFREVEVYLSKLIAQACRNLKIPLIQLSSIIAFGRKLPDIPVDEAFVGSEFEMIDKVCIEREEIIKSIYNDSSEFLILRPVPIIGSNDKGGTLRRIFDRYLEGNFPLVEGGSASVTFIDKRDFGNAVELSIRCFEKIKGNTLIVGGFNANWLHIKQAFDSYYKQNQTFLSLTKEDAENQFGLRTAEFISNSRLFNDNRFRNLTGFLPSYTLVDAIYSYAYSNQPD
jgi:nucleoside-diphosphate-sugar epimerase